MNPPAADWERLASYVTSARLAAGYDGVRAFAAAIGISERTLGKLERGERVGTDTLAVVARHLGWTPDSPLLILRGGEPRSLDSIRRPREQKARPDTAPPHSRAPSRAAPSGDDARKLRPEIQALIPRELELVRASIEIAEASLHPGEELTGEKVFPGSPKDAVTWDRNRHDHDRDGLAWLVAAARAYDRWRESGTGTGR